MKRHSAQTLIVMLLALAASTSASATTLVRMSLAQMSRAAREIVRGRCVANTTAWDAGELWTFTSFDVRETWRGVAHGRITIRLLGGTDGTITSHVFGVPRFSADEEVILFLEPTIRGDFSVVSWEQGTFRIARDRAGASESVTQDTSSFETFDPATRRFAPTGIRNMPIAAFRAQINTALANTSSGGEKP